MDFLVKNTVENDLVDMLHTMKENRNTHWSTHDVLSVFSQQYCDVHLLLFLSFTERQCGQFAWHVIWLMVPPVKVCSRCITNPDYDFVEANRACGIYKVRRSHARANRLATIKCSQP